MIVHNSLLLFIAVCIVIYGQEFTSIYKSKIDSWNRNTDCDTEFKSASNLVFKRDHQLP